HHSPQRLCAHTTTPATLASRLPRPPPATLFPYTTLFRSLPRPLNLPKPPRTENRIPSLTVARPRRDTSVRRRLRLVRLRRRLPRSEEHTSELQSRENLVCRLLLEKKNRSDDTREMQPRTR